MAAWRANRKKEEKITRSGSRFNFFKSRPVSKKSGTKNPIPCRPDSILFNPDPNIPGAWPIEIFFKFGMFFSVHACKNPPQFAYGVRFFRQRGIENALDFFQNFRSNPKVSQFAFPLNDVKCELTTSILYPSNLVILPRYIGRRTEGSLHLIATCLPERSKVIFESKDNAEHENSVKMKIGLLNRWKGSYYRDFRF